MKTIGLIGGMSWASTALYYRLLNQQVMHRLGGLSSARLLLASLDFAEVVAGQKAGEWDRLASLLGDSARRLERAGADIVLIATNTMHKVADAVQAQLSVPLREMQSSLGLIAMQSLVLAHSGSRHAPSGQV